MNQKSFVETYGAYLQIQTCLSAAASVKDEVAISAILKAARNDPCHQDATREIYKSNSNGLLFYDSVSVYLFVLPFTIDCRDFFSLFESTVSNIRGDFLVLVGMPCRVVLYHAI